MPKLVGFSRFAALREEQTPSQRERGPGVVARNAIRRLRLIKMHLRRVLINRDRPGNRWPMIAVGTRITSRPPHRTVRAQFGHTAPTLGV
jgi:hypothetical protein